MGKTQPPTRSKGLRVYEAARALWRRCFALSLALRLLARMVLLALAGFFTGNSNLDEIDPFLAGIGITGHSLFAPAPAAI